MTTEIKSLAHWDRTLDANGICWLTLDKAGSTTNTLDQEILTELDTVLEEEGGERIDVANDGG